MSVAEEFHSEPAMARPLPFGINRSLLPIKAYYCVFMAAVGDLLPYIALFMMQIGLNDTETGIIYGVMPFVGFFVRPVFGAMADKFHRHKLVLIFVTIFTGLFYLLLVTVPQRPGPQFYSVSTTLECNTQNSFLEDCALNGDKNSCHVSLSHFSNASEALSVKDNGTLAQCSFQCQESNGEEFQACFTNDTNPFDSDSCDGIIKSGKQLSFTVKDMQSVLDAEIIQHTPPGCKIFDLKDVHHQQSKAWQILCDRELNLECKVSCKSEVCKATSSAYDRSFFLFFFLFLMANIAFSPIFPVLDAATYDILGEKRHQWGKQRLWGTFGFAAFALTSSFVMYYWRKNEEEVEYSYLFYIFGVLCFLAAFLANFIPFSSDIKCSQFMKNVWKLLSVKEVSVFLLVIMYFGFVLGGLEAFLFRFLSEMGSSPLVFGFMLLVNCCAEIPMLWIAGAIIKKIGLISCLYLALFCCGIRLLAYSLLYEPWLVLLVEPVHGVTFALMYAAASSYASIIAPPGMSATVQGLLGGVHFGFGKGIGSLITGFLCGSIGARMTWRLFSIVSFVILVVYFLLNKFVFTSPNSKAPETGGAVDGGPRDQDRAPPDQLLVPVSGDEPGSFPATPEDNNHLNKI